MLRVGVAVSSLLLSFSAAYADYGDKLEKIRSQIQSSPTIGPHNVEILYRQDSVILKGEAASQDDIQEMVNIAANSDEDIDDVTNWLSVSPELARTEMASIETEESDRMARYEARERESFFADPEIEKRVAATLKQSDRTNADKIDVDVSNGTVHLRGSMPDFRAIDRALATVLMVEGVKDLQSDLTIRGQPYRTERWIR